jgi:hypothetical protein
MDLFVYIEITFQNSVRTPQETHYVSVTKPNRLMLFRETVAVYCESHTEHIECRVYVKAGGKYNNLRALKVKSLCCKVPVNTTTHSAAFEVLTAVAKKRNISDVTPCSLVEVHRRSG